MAEDIATLAGRIELIGFDVDGVFTDGRFYLANDGSETKAFNTQDGYGIRSLLCTSVEIAVISGRRSEAVERRMRELGVRHVVLGCRDKVASFGELRDALGVDKLHTAFVGDDIPDLALLEQVGVPFAVANAVDEVRAAAAYTTRKAGGFGAVREICDLLIRARNTV